MPNGKPGVYNVVETRGSVYILPITKEGNIVLVRLFRYTTQSDSWEIPAGGIEDEEHPLLAAKRELQEELGCEAEKWENLGSIEPANGIMSAKGHIFLAQGLAKQGKNEQLEEGITETKAFTPGKIRHMLADNIIVDGPTLSALLLAIAKGRLTL